jgi:thioredoxin 1
MGRLILLVVVALLAVAGYTAFRNSQQRAAAGSAGAGGHAGVTLFSKMTYKEAVEASKGKLLVVDATATWCPPCQMMERDTWPDATLTSWVKDNGVAVQIDVDQDPTSARDLRISAMPTVILFRDGKELGRTQGYMTASEMLNWLTTTAS